VFKESANRGASPSSPVRKPARVSEPVRKGASSGLEYSGFKAYFAHHWCSAKSSLRRLLVTPFSSLLTWLVIAIALALPVGLMVLLDNVAGLTDNLEGSSRLTLYMKLDQDDQQSLLIAQQIKARTDVESVEFIDRQQALEEFKVASGWGDVLAYLDSNPLPSVIIVQPGLILDNVDMVRQLMAELEKLPGVENIQIDLQWVKRLHALFALLERFLFALAALFGLAVILTIGNTIRLSIENRRDEIVVVKLVGGTDPYVRRPFLYTGFWYGVIGAVIAWMMVNASLLWLGKPVNELAELYYSQFNLRGLSLQTTIMLFLVGGFLGSAGAWIAVKRHLDDIEPS
jgi:cell division transport system permease protein